MLVRVLNFNLTKKLGKNKVNTLIKMYSFLIKKLRTKKETQRLNNLNTYINIKMQRLL